MIIKAFGVFVLVEVAGPFLKMMVGVLENNVLVHNLFGQSVLKYFAITYETHH